MMIGRKSEMKRTTSMTEFTLDFDYNQPSDQPHLVSGVKSRRNSVDLVQTAPFLRACCLCKHRLIPGRDIYMYRGDSAFCSVECRQQQMAQDERKDKCSLASKKEAAASSAAAGSRVSATG